MRAIQIAVLSAITSVAMAQQPPSAACRFDRRFAALRSITSGSSELKFDPVPALQNRPYFLTGETVWVSRELQGWSCATTTVETAKGWVTESGWIASSRLERVEPAKAGPVK